MKCLISWIECKEYSSMVHGIMCSFIRLHEKVNSIWQQHLGYDFQEGKWENIILGVLTTIYTGHPTGNLVHNSNRTTKFELGGRTTCYKVYPNQPNRLKRVEKWHHLKLQPIFSEVSLMEWHKPFDFPSRISGFNM